MTSVQKWKPGDVGVNVRHGYRGIFVKDCPTHARDCWHNESGYSDAGWGERRPLAVIDPEDREQVERLMGLARDNAEIGAESWQAALREFAALPPQIEEPTGLGAVVEDADGECWLRCFGDSGYYIWRRAGDFENQRVQFADLDVVRVLSAGVEVPA